MWFLFQNSAININESFMQRPRLSKKKKNYKSIIIHLSSDSSMLPTTLNLCSIDTKKPQTNWIYFFCQQIIYKFGIEN